MDLLTGRFDLEVEYFPFELDPHMPGEGTDHHEYLCRKFGGASRYDALTNHVSRIAARKGIEFNQCTTHHSPTRCASGAGQGAKPLTSPVPPAG